MLTAVIATHESERPLVRTLAALVPGATAGLIAEVIVADANSSDATAEVADIAGCRYVASAEPLAMRSMAVKAKPRPAPACSERTNNCRSRRSSSTCSGVVQE